MKRKIFFVVLPFLFLQALVADEPVAADESAAADKTIVSNELELQLASEPAVKFAFTRRYTIPFLQGESPLTKDNNIDISLRAEVSPVSLNGLVEAVWTPIAFFQLIAGGMIGSGWNISLFGDDVYGIGLNYANAENNAAHSGDAFDGALLKAQAGMVLQADLAAVFPGDWNHIVFRTYHEINRKDYTRAKAGESWYLENDFGENVNGFSYYGNLLLGYQMPIFLNMAALLMEADLNLYDLPNQSRWGGDKILWTFSGVLNFTVSKQLSAAVITQFRTVRNYKGDWEDLYYRNRELEKNKPLVWEFYRVAAIMTYKL